MNLWFNILFLIFALYFGFSEAGLCPKNTVVFQNSLALSQSTLKVHCRSFDDDLGDHSILFKAPPYNFSFHDEIVFATWFDCDLFHKGENVEYQRSFRAYRGAYFFRCGALYVWNARDDAIYLSKDRKPEKLMYYWIKD
uniref:S-protein homolog n=1 Tax=Brassica oleracea var. oleracea TaxID=109376 RepID=A0A0D2ZZ18_BRAOL